jgi:PAS domain-containing protein
MKDESFYRLIVEASDEPVGILDCDLVIRYGNPSHRRTLGAFSAI